MASFKAVEGQSRFAAVCQQIILLWGSWRGFPTLGFRGCPWRLRRRNGPDKFLIYASLEKGRPFLLVRGQRFWRAW